MQWFGGQWQTVSIQNSQRLFTVNVFDILPRFIKNLLEMQYLVCSTTTRTKRALRILQLSFRIFTASLSRRFGINVSREAKTKILWNSCVLSCVSSCVWGWSHQLTRPDFTKDYKCNFNKPFLCTSGVHSSIQLANWSLTFIPISVWIRCFDLPPSSTVQRSNTSSRKISWNIQVAGTAVWILLLHRGVPL